MNALQQREGQKSGKLPTSYSATALDLVGFRSTKLKGSGTVTSGVHRFGCGRGTRAVRGAYSSSLKSSHL
jgi:hypothetical protein